MTERNASPQRIPPLPRPPDHDHERGHNHDYDHPSPSTARNRLLDPDRHATTGSPEAGESSRSGSLMGSPWPADATLAQRPSADDPLAHDDSTAHRHDDRLERHEQGTRDINRGSHHHRSHKHKSTGAFLLSDPFGEPATDDARGRKQRPRRTVDKGKDPSAGHSHHGNTSNARHAGVGLGLPPDLKKTGSISHGPSPGTPPRTMGMERRQDGLLQVSPGVPSPQSSHSSMDMDSTQIVSMALNLSESRRLAQRRIASQPVPPRLAPLPTDNNVAGTLRHQLQQQRRVSRTVSPRPDRAAGQRILSNGKTNGSLQPPFVPMMNEASYHYKVSNSTFARAQKAREYMELLTQYRRALEFLPPLKPNSLSTVSTGDNPPLSMPMSLDSINSTGQIGRPYNPLQYIRNRKVRARERKTIDGQSQGFGDVNRVTDWVDEVAKSIATRQIRIPGSPALPPFSGADVFSMDNSPPTHLPRPAMPAVKPKRPRNDWIIEPADLLADVYWLEQDDHKRLVEDRNWRRVFPQDSELYRPLSRATDEASPGLASVPSAHHLATDGDHTPGKLNIDWKGQKSDNDQAPSSTRKRARLKLQELRSFHRYGSIHDDKHSHNRLRGRRDSTSSSSSSDSEKRSRRCQSGDTGKDILEKQMLEMMAREAREAKENEAKFSQEPDLKPLKTRPSDIAAPPQSSAPGSAAESRQHSRRESRIDASDVDDKNIVIRSRVASPQRPSRESLEVPPFRGRRMSLGSESSVPNSPDFKASRRDNYFMPGIGADLSPSSSRPGSPSRNPLSRVKHIFRDRSRDRDRAAERQQEALSSEKEGLADVVLTGPSGLSSAPELAPDKPASQSRTNSIGPEAKLASRTTGNSHRPHRKTNSLRLADPGAGLRSLFKGPRIDSVLKSGVSKVSELFWKKDSEVEDSDTSTSLSDDSDDERRGRRKDTRLVTPTSSLRGRPGQAKQERHYLDVMPAFVPASEHGGTHSRSGSIGVSMSRTTSRRSTRFDLLKPPRIDISAAVDSPSDPNKGHVVDPSDPDARLGSIQEGGKVEARRPSLSIRPPNDRRVSAESIRSSRHFSIAEKDFTPGHALVSRREVARLRAMALSSGIMAMEMARRAHQPTTLTPSTRNDSNEILAALGPRISWPDVIQLAPEEHRSDLLADPVSQAQLFPFTARVLGAAIHTSRQRWQAEAESFKQRTRNELIEGRIETLRARAQLDLTAMTRAAAEEADEVGGDLVDGQRRKVKAVVDVIDKLLRRRRRRFRWARRAGWLALEWLLVGFMWYVWFVVMIARVFLGIGKGAVRGVRWLFWL